MTLPPGSTGHHSSGVPSVVAPLLQCFSAWMAHLWLWDTLFLANLGWGSHVPCFPGDCTLCQWRRPRNLRTVLPIRSQSSYISLYTFYLYNICKLYMLYKFWDRGLDVKLCGIHSFHNPVLAILMTPYKIKKECYPLRSCLVSARRMIMVYGQAGISADGEVWSMHNANMRYMVEKREEAKGQRKFFMFKFLLSCHKIILFNTGQREWRSCRHWWPFFWNCFHEFWISLGRSRGHSSIEP